MALLLAPENEDINSRIKEVKLLIIDEADRMLDMGFIPDIIKVNQLLPRIRQTLFFSATLSSEILDIGKDLLINPKEITISPELTTSENIDSIFVKFEKKNRLSNLKNLIELEEIRSAVVFCNKKKGARFLAASRVPAVPQAPPLPSSWPSSAP